MSRTLSRLRRRFVYHRLPPGVELRTAAHATRILARRLGLPRALAVLAEVGLASARGEPFRHLARPIEAREALSRQQAGPAILLHRALRRRLDVAEALDVLREVTVAGAVIFLGHTIGALDRERLMALSPEAREELVRETGGRFFNATVTWDEISEERVRFTVTHCRFPELCASAGAPEVAPLLCAGDAVYFGEVLGTVTLDRPHTRAEGAERCPFTLTWA